MKLLIVLLVVLFGVWLWRRERALQRPTPAARTPRSVQPMVACAHCGVHVPQTSAVVGRSGMYCCQAHQQEAEGG